MKVKENFANATAQGKTKAASAVTEGTLQLTITDLRAQAQAAGVSREDALPFLLEPAAPPLGAILLVHGFTATPWEMRPLAEDLRAAGYTALAVRLPGHGTSAEDLRTRNYVDWLNAVVEGYRLLRGGHQKVFGIGMSTGGLLLALLASGAPLTGLVLLSPYLRLAHPLAPLTGLLHHWHPYQERPLAPGDEGHYYQRRPLAGIVQLRRLSRELTPQLSQVTLPALVVAAEGDQTVDVASGLELFRRLGSRHKEYHRFGPDVPHVLTTSFAIRERLRQLLFSFLAAAPTWS